MIEKINKKMNTKKAESYIALKTHFGWEKNEYNEMGDRARFVLSRDSKKVYHYEVKKLEKQYNVLNKKFPTGFLVWLIFAGGSIAPYFILDYTWNFVFIIACTICSGISLFLLLAFIMNKMNAKKNKAFIIKQADNVSGIYCSEPYGQNIVEPSKTTGNLSKFIRE